MHRLVSRAKDHFRGRPNSERFVVGSESDSLTKIKITEGEWHWLGETWYKSNNRVMPSLNQIEAGLITEAMKQVEKAMGSISDHKNQLATKANIKKTWEELFGKANIQGEDRDQPLMERDLSDATYPATILLVFIYQMENWCYSELNRACRYKDHSKINSLGPWAKAMSEIVY